MTHRFELRRIHESAIPRTIEKAEHYRLLNDPEQAESICLDVLEIDADNQKALVILILSLTDQFAAESGVRGGKRVRKLIPKLEDEYARVYYSGLICEREARAHVRRPRSRSFAYDAFREAMDWYEKAEALRKPGNDDPLLRWNSCARTIMNEGLEPGQASGELPLE